jgi:hypothetical protein
LKHYTPITAPDVTHLINPVQVDKWSIHRATKEIAIFNMSHRCSSSLTLDALETALTALPLPTDHLYFFHTTSWKGSLNIIEGVDRLQGRRCLDFGIYPGFYMSGALIDCLDWGVKKNKLWSYETAIMVFAIPKMLPSHLSFKDLRGREWSSIVREARECKGTREIESIRSIDLLYGNMVGNPTAVEQGTQAPATHRPPKKQFVSKTDAGDSFVHACLVGCIYFQKHI